jgi:type 1 glutamine amidotransferase
MNSFHRKISLALALLALITLVANAAPLRVLYFTKSAGWEHDVVKRVDGQPSFSERVLAQLGPKHGIEFTFSKDGSLFSPEYLTKFDVIMFYTSGDLLATGVDGQPPMTPAGKQALLDAVAGGKGFVALHSGCDTFHTGEKGGGNNPIPPSRYQNFGEASDPFIKMVGGEFLKHSVQQVATVQVIDPRFPGMAALGERLALKEEWYSLKEFAADMHVVLVLQTAGMHGSDYQRPPFPIAWARKYGQGRVWFNAMGHREDVWESAAFQVMLLGGLEWAGGRLEADSAPNLKAAAPEATTLPPYVPGFD